MLEESDEILIKKCIEWDRSAQNMLYKKYGSKMFAVCFRYSRSREEAEDTFHEGFMKVFENIKSFRKTGLLESWIRRIMVNTAIEKYRKNSPLSVVVSMDDPRVDVSHYYSNEVHGQIAAKELMQKIQKLPPAYRMVFNLYVFESLKHKEIAEMLGISEGTSKSNLSDARAILQRAIEKDFSARAQAVGNHGRK